MASPQKPRRVQGSVAAALSRAPFFQAWGLRDGIRRGLRARNRGGRMRSLFGDVRGFGVIGEMCGR
jgi:hypothetical protein